MKTDSKYKLYKEIKTLRAERDRLLQYRSVVLELYDWLHKFGKNENADPNAAYGLHIIGRLLR